MKHTISFQPPKFSVALIACCIITACGGGGETTSLNNSASAAPSNPVQQPQPQQNLAIQATANKNDIAVGENVELVARGFYTEGEITKFEWQQESGPVVELFSNTKTGQAWFRATKEAANTSITLSLLATTNDGKSQKEQVTINVSNHEVNPACLLVTSKSGRNTNYIYPVELNNTSSEAAVIDLLSGDSLTMNYRDCSVVPITHVHSEIVSQNIPLTQVHLNTFAEQYPGFEIHPAINSTGRVTVSATVHFSNGRNSVFTHIINVI